MKMRLYSFYVPSIENLVCLIRCDEMEEVVIVQKDETIPSTGVHDAYPYSITVGCVPYSEYVPIFNAIENGDDSAVELFEQAVMNHDTDGCSCAGLRESDVYRELGPYFCAAVKQIMDFFEEHEMSGFEEVKYCIGEVEGETEVLYELWLTPEKKPRCANGDFSGVTSNYGILIDALEKGINKGAFAWDEGNDNEKMAQKCVEFCLGEIYFKSAFEQVALINAKLEHAFIDLITQNEFSY